MEESKRRNSAHPSPELALHTHVATVSSEVSSMKSTLRYIVILGLLLTVTLSVLFGLVIGANELSKESHVKTEGSTAVLRQAGSNEVVQVSTYSASSSLPSLLAAVTIAGTPEMAKAPADMMNDLNNVLNSAKDFTLNLGGKIRKFSISGYDVHTDDIKDNGPNLISMTKPSVTLYTTTGFKLNYIPKDHLMELVDAQGSVVANKPTHGRSLLQFTGGPAEPFPGQDSPLMDQGEKYADFGRDNFMTHAGNAGVTLERMFEYTVGMGSEDFKWFVLGQATNPSYNCGACAKSLDCMDPAMGQTMGWNSRTGCSDFVCDVIKSAQPDKAATEMCDINYDRVHGDTYSQSRCCGNPNPCGTPQCIAYQRLMQAGK